MRAITAPAVDAPPRSCASPASTPPPPLAAGQVVVDVHAASLNPADWHLVRGVPYLARLQIGLRRPPFHVPGSDFDGIVSASGRGVTAVEPGDEVYGTTFMAGFRAFAERVAVPEPLVARRPGQRAVHGSGRRPPRRDHRRAVRGGAHQRQGGRRGADRLGSCRGRGVPAVRAPTQLEGTDRRRHEATRAS